MVTWVFKRSPNMYRNSGEAGTLETLENSDKVVYLRIWRGTMTQVRTCIHPGEIKETSGRADCESGKVTSK